MRTRGELDGGRRVEAEELALPGVGEVMMAMQVTKLASFLDGAFVGALASVCTDTTTPSRLELLRR